MGCENCGALMKRKRWITGYWFSDWIAGELIFLLLILPLALAGPIGWSVIAGIILVLVAISYRRTWYRCSNCGNKKMVKR